MRSEFEIESPDDMQVKMTITMSMSEWKVIRRVADGWRCPSDLRSINDGVTVELFVAAIDDVVEQMSQVLYASPSRPASDD